MTADRTPTQRLPVVAAPEGRGLRAAEVIAGLLGGGLALLGVVLLLVQLFAPAVVDDADGPGWGVGAAHLLVGAAAETARGFRKRLPVVARRALAGATIVAVLLVLLLSWWR